MLTKQVISTPSPGLMRLNSVNVQADRCRSRRRRATEYGRTTGLDRSDTAAADGRPAHALGRRSDLLRRLPRDPVGPLLRGRLDGRCRRPVRSVAAPLAALRRAPGRHGVVPRLVAPAEAEPAPRLGA